MLGRVTVRKHAEGVYFVRWRTRTDTWDSKVFATRAEADHFAVKVRRERRRFWR